MLRLPHIAAFAVCACLPGCGGGGSDAPPSPSPVPAPVELVLSASNYQSALQLSMASTQSVLTYAQLGAEGADSLFNQPIPLGRNFPCAVSGTRDFELSDRNSNRALDVNDTLSLFFNDCDSGAGVVSGVMRIEIVEVTPFTDGRDYRLRLTFGRFSMPPAVLGTPRTTADFSATVYFSRVADGQQYRIEGGGLELVTSGRRQAVTGFVVDYLHNYSTSRYNLVGQGTVDSDALGGRFTFATALAFTGDIGSYPGAGRMSVVAGAGATAQLSEEGAALADNATVLAALDSNGDGIRDATIAELPWSDIVSQSLFEALRDADSTP